MANVSLHDVVKRYNGQTVVDGVSLTVKQGEFVTLLGPSGCGKTTCLRMIAGFVQPDAGAIHIGGEEVSNVPPYARETGMVFQQYALFPHLTIAQNIAFGLQIRKRPKAEIGRRVADVLALVELEGFDTRLPDQLSGGQKQRVALARALVVNPKVLLLDEPFGALDQSLRESLQREVRRIQRDIGITTIFVTHDQNEALRLSDRIIVMRQGRIRQAGTPQELYEKPSDRYVANALGKINLLRVAPVAGGVPQWLGLRPEHIRLDSTLPNQRGARVESTTYAGDGWLLELDTTTGEKLLVKTANRSVPSPGDAVTVGWEADHGVLLPEDEIA